MIGGEYEELFVIFNWNIIMSTQAKIVCVLKIGIGDGFISDSLWNIFNLSFRIEISLMENYRKGKNVEEELSKEQIPIEILPE